MTRTNTRHEATEMVQLDAKLMGMENTISVLTDALRKIAFGLKDDDVFDCIEISINAIDAYEKGES